MRPNPLDRAINAAEAAGVDSGMCDAGLLFSASATRSIKDERFEPASVPPPGCVAVPFAFARSALFAEIIGEDIPSLNGITISLKGVALGPLHRDVWTVVATRCASTGCTTATFSRRELCRELGLKVNGQKIKAITAAIEDMMTAYVVAVWTTGNRYARTLLAGFKETQDTVSVEIDREAEVLFEWAAFLDKNTWRELSPRQRQIAAYVRRQADAHSMPARLWRPIFKLAGGSQKEANRRLRHEVMGAEEALGVEDAAVSRDGLFSFRRAS